MILSVRQVGSGFTVSARLYAGDLQQASSSPPHTHTHTSRVCAIFFHLMRQPLYPLSECCSFREEGRRQPVPRPPTGHLTVSDGLSVRTASDDKSRVTMTQRQTGCGLCYCFARLDSSLRCCAALLTLDLKWFSIQEIKHDLKAGRSCR